MNPQLYFRLYILAVFSVLWVCSTNAEIYDQWSETDQIEIEDGANMMALTSDGSKLYIIGSPEWTPSRITVWDTATQSIQATLSLSAGIPLAMKLSPDDSKLYIAISSSVGHIHSGGVDRVEVVDTQTLQSMASIPTPGWPTRLTLTPDGQKLYVANRANSTVSVIDAQAHTLLSTIALPPMVVNGKTISAFPIGIDASPTESRVYVSGKANQTIYVIETLNDTLATTFSVTVKSTNSTAISIHPDGKRGYLTGRQESRITVFDTDPSSPAYHSEIAVLETGGSNLDSMAFHSLGTHLLIVSSGSNEVLIWDTDSTSPNFHTEIQSVEVGYKPWDIVFHPSVQGFAYVTNRDEDSLSILNIPQPDRQPEITRIEAILNPIVSVEQALENIVPPGEEPSLADITNAYNLPPDATFSEVVEALNLPPETRPAELLNQMDLRQDITFDELLHFLELPPDPTFGEIRQSLRGIDRSTRRDVVILFFRSRW